MTTSIEEDLTRPLNRKDITAEITGQAFDFDDESAQQPVNINPQQQQQMQNQMHPLVGVLDMMIGTSPIILKKYGYPAPETAIWNEWGKPNFNQALNIYFPMTGTNGQAIPQPMIALGIGGLALVLTFLPVIMHWKVEHDKKVEAEKAKEHEPEPEEIATPQGYTKPASIPASDEPIEAEPPQEERQMNTPMMDLIAKNMETTESQPI